MACDNPVADTQELTGTVTIDGTAAVGQTLTANTGSLGGSGVVSYVWLANGQPISGATESSYELVVDDIGSTISVRVTRAGYKDSVTGGPTATVTADDRPELTGTVTIEGTPTVGQTLTAITSALQGEGALSYHWLRGSTDIPGASGASYEVTVDDIGSTISVRVTRAGYKDSVTSVPTEAVTADDRDPLTGTVTIEATAEVGQTLTAVTDLQGSGTVFYQWLANSQPIFGATESSYTVAEDDIGSTISVRITRADNSGSVTSDPTAAVTVPPPVTGTPNITIGYNYGAITITGSNGANVIYKTSADPKSLTLSATGYTEVNWYLDGDNSSAGTANPITLNANDYSAKAHTITFTGKKDGKVYSQTITFTVKN